MTTNELTHGEKVYLYAFGVLEGLINKGMLIGPKALTDTGRQEFEALKNSGFKTTDAELHEAIQGIIQENIVYGAR